MVVEILQRVIIQLAISRKARLIREPFDLPIMPLTPLSQTTPAYSTPIYLTSPLTLDHRNHLLTATRTSKSKATAPRPSNRQLTLLDLGIVTVWTSVTTFVSPFGSVIVFVTVLV